MNEKLEKYPSTEKFRIKDTIGVPHPYCIGSRHVAHAADHFSGRLGDKAIESAEKIGIKCDICRVNGMNLSYKEYEQALVVEVDDERDLNDIPELREYLIQCKPMCEADKFAGFAFVKK